MSGWQAWSDPTHDAPLPRHDHRARRDRLRRAVAHQHGADVTVLLTGREDVRWACGFTGSNGQLLLAPDRSTLVTDARYVGRAAVETPDLDVAVERSWHLVAADHGNGALLVDGERLTHRRFVALVEACEQVGSSPPRDAGDLTGTLRARKQPAELARLARACAITDLVLDDVVGELRAGDTERQLARRVADGFRARGAEPGFASIVAGGPNGAIPHHEPTDRPVAGGELVTIDVGARVEGYHADTTRTVVVPGPGRVDPELAAAYGHVAAAQEAGVAAARAGVTAGDVDAAARDVVDAAGYGAAFVHGTGHGVGLAIHEAPTVGEGSPDSLSRGVTLTVEPGIYLPGSGGIRIEDTCVVTDHGPARRLTRSPRTLFS